MTIDRTVLVTYRPRPLHPIENLATEHHAAARSLLERVKSVAGTPDFSDEADKESSWEELFRLAAGLETFPAENSWVAEVTGDGLGTPIPREGNTNELPESFDIHWGPGTEGVRLRHSLGSEVFAYWEYAAFQRAAGREHVVCGYAMDGEGVDVVDIGEALAAKSIEPGRLFIKGTRSKSLAGSAVIKSSGGYRYLSFDNEYADAGLWRFEGRPEFLLAQPYVPMTHEYRFFIINGRPVAGSSNAPDLTPFQHQERFDDRMRETTGSLAADHRRLDAYRELATRVSAELWEEDPRLTGYVLDVATGPEGPLVVELNTLGASGLFAVDPQHVAAALKQGEPSLRRPWTANIRTDTGTTLITKRCCSHCGEPLGDLSAADLKSLVAGAWLPDTRQEHGC